MQYFLICLYILTGAVQEDSGNLLIPNASPEDAGKYVLHATSPAGEAVHDFKVDVVCTYGRAVLLTLVIQNVSALILSFDYYSNYIMHAFRKLSRHMRSLGRSKSAAW